MARGVACRVDDRVGEDLELQRGAASIAGHLRDRCGEVAASAVAEDRNTVGVATDVGCVRVRPQQRGVAVLDGNREPELGRTAIVSGDDHATAVVRDAATGAVVRVEIAEHPPAAVEKHHDRSGLVGRRPVHAHRDLAAVDRDRVVGDVVDRFGLGDGHTGHGRGDRDACFVAVLRLVEAREHRVHHVDQCFSRGVESHGAHHGRPEPALLPAAAGRSSPKFGGLRTSGCPRYQISRSGELVRRYSPTLGLRAAAGD